MLLLLYVHVSSCFLPKVLPGSSYSSWSFPCRLGAQHNTLNAALPTWNCHPKDCLHLPHHRGQQSYIKNTVGNQETTVFSYLFLSAVLIFAPFVPFWCWHFRFLMFSHWAGWNHLWISQMLDKWYSLMKLTKTSRHFRNNDDLRVSYLGVKECDPVSEDQFDINGFATQIWQAAYVTNAHTSQASN